jgi:hypothetical protein
MDTYGRGEVASTGFSSENVHVSISWIDQYILHRRYHIWGGVIFPEEPIWDSLITQILCRPGFRDGLFRGDWAGLATYGPFSAIYFVVYEQWKLRCSRFLESRTVDSLTMPYHLSGGIVAGSVAAVTTAPIDAIKTRMQV